MAGKNNGLKMGYLLRFNHRLASCTVFCIFKLRCDHPHYASARRNDAMLNPNMPATPSAAAAPSSVFASHRLRPGSLNLEGRFQREVVDNVDAGVVYKFNE